MLKCHDQKQLGEEFILPCTYESITKGRQGRSLKTGTKADTMEERCLLSCSSWLAQPVSCMYTPGTALKMNWALRNQSLIQKMHERLAYKRILRRHVLNWEFLFPTDPSLCQVDIKLASTAGFLEIKLRTSYILSKYSWGSCSPVIQLILHEG